VPVRKLVDLDVLETSGVDHPAHMSEGWLVIKSDGRDGAAEELARMAGDGRTDKEHTMPEELPELSPEAQAAVSERDEKIAALTKQVEDLTVAVEKAAESANDEGQDDDGLSDDVLKAMPEPVRAAIEKARTDAEEATKAATAATEELRKEREQAADREAVEKARGWSNIGVDPEELGPMLRKAATVDADLGTKLESTLSALSAQVSTGELFKSFGSDKDAEGSSAEREIMVKAKELVESGGAKTMPEAVSAVAKANPDLYKRSRAENGA